MDECIRRDEALKARPELLIEDRDDPTIALAARWWNKAVKEYEANISKIPAADVIEQGWHERICDRCGKTFLTQFNTLCSDCEEEVIMQVLIEKGKVGPVIEAEWIEHEDDSIGQYWECSHCHVSFCLIEGDMYYKRCPECGAVMKAVRRVTG